jgi:hypothetical protein
MSRAKKIKPEVVWVVEAIDSFWPKDTWAAVGRTFYGSRSEAMTHVWECRSHKEPHMKYRPAKYVREG